MEQTNNTDFQYKEHSDFFEDYYMLRKKAFQLLSASVVEPKNAIDLYTIILTLVDFTSNYIFDLQNVDTKMNDLDKLFSKKDYVGVVKSSREILRYINEQHEKSSLLPQKINNSNIDSNFWRDEETKALKEMKKAFYDIFMQK